MWGSHLYSFTFNIEGLVEIRKTLLLLKTADLSKICLKCFMNMGHTHNNAELELREAVQHKDLVEEGHSELSPYRILGTH